MPRHRLKGVRAARRVEPTAGRQRRAYPTTVRDDGSCQHTGTECAGSGPPGHPAHSGRRPERRGRRAAARAASRSAASRSYVRSAAPGSARTTRVVPAGSVVNRSRTRCRNRRRTLLRTTAPPTALETTKPARAGAESCSVPAGRTGSGVAVSGPTDGEADGRSRWTTTAPLPARRPPRTATANSPLRRSRCAAASTTSTSPGPGRSALRPTGGHGPWRDGSKGWRGRRGYACAAGSRGSSRAGGCSAGRCACSRQALRLRTSPGRSTTGSDGGPPSTTERVAYGRCCPVVHGPARRGVATADSKHPSP